MNDKMIFGQYVNVDSWVHKLDPRTKILTLFMLMIGVFLINNLYVLLGCFLFVLIIVLSSRIPISKFLNSFKMIAMLLIFTTAFQILFNTNGNILVINGITMSKEFDLTILSLIIDILLLVIYFLLGKVIKKFRVIQFIIIIIFGFYIQTVINITPSIVKYTISLYDEAFFFRIKSNNKNYHFN